MKKTTPACRFLIQTDTAFHYLFGFLVIGMNILSLYYFYEALSFHF